MSWYSTKNLKKLTFYATIADTMKYQKSKKLKSKKPSLKSVIIGPAVVIFIFILLLLLETRGVINLYSDKSKPSDTTSDQPYIDYSPPSEEELQASEDDKVDKIDNSSSNNSIDEEVKVDETYYDSTSEELVVKTKLLGLNWNMCTLTVTKDVQKITKESKTIYQPEYSICQGFAVAKSEFNSSGEWTIQLTATTLDGDTMNSEEVKVVIEL